MVTPEGQMLIIENHDKPGVVGKIGTFLGQHNVNISNMQLGLNTQTKKATAFYTVQGDVTEDTIAGLKNIDGILSAMKVIFS